MSDINPKHHRAILLLIAGRSSKEVACELNVTQRTVDLWKSDPDFKNLLNESVSKCFQENIAELILHSQQAIFKLKAIIDDEAEPTRIKLIAIQTLLNHALKAKEYLTPKIQGTNSEQIIQYYLQHGSSDEVFKALEFERREKEFKLKTQEKISLDSLNTAVAIICKTAIKYITPEYIDDFSNDLARTLVETRQNTIT